MPAPSPACKLDAINGLQKAEAFEAMLVLLRAVRDAGALLKTGQVCRVLNISETTCQGYCETGQLEHTKLVNVDRARRGEAKHGQRRLDGEAWAPSPPRAGYQYRIPAISVMMLCLREWHGLPHLSAVEFGELFVAMSPRLPLGALRVIKSVAERRIAEIEALRATVIGKRPATHEQTPLL